MTNDGSRRVVTRGSRARDGCRRLSDESIAAGRAIMIVLEPRSQTSCVEYVTAGETQGGAHRIATDDTIVVVFGEFLGAHRFVNVGDVI